MTWPRELTYEQKLVQAFAKILNEEIDELKAENKKLKEQLHLHDVAGRSQLILIT
jgi:ABC-type arginine transport system ATPase subunit